MTISKKKCICLSGLDGTGKTYLSTKIIEDIEKKIKIKHIWSRYRNYTSKPLLLITKLTGHNYKEIINGTKIGYHDFHNNKILSILFLFFQWIDQFLEIIFRFRISKFSLVADRSLIDTLVDISVDTKSEKFIFGFYAKTLFKLMPSNTIYIIIQRDLNLIKKDRPDVFYDKNRKLREELYKKISKIYPIYTVQNNNYSNESLNEIFNIIDNHEKNC
jgi:thymidylate kinase|tara:strand:+ start:318 stop:968 length:651 start_codon:yes stop_codon:yes gene_type:complete